MDGAGFDPLVELKKLDFERYTACLYLPEETRNHAAVLCLFDAEIARIPDLISEPMPGEIRLQFWQDLIAGKSDVQGAGPLGEALLNTIKSYNLPLETFHNCLNARIFDLYNDPMPDVSTLEGYLGETHSAFFQMVCLINAAERSRDLADACGHAGMAFGIARLLSGLSVHQKQARCYIPSSIIEKHGLTRDTWLFQTPESEHLEALNEMIDLGLDHLKQAELSYSSLPKDKGIAFLPLVFAEKRLKKARSLGVHLFENPIHLSSLKIQWAAFIKVLRGL